ncbi:hypothetical protein BJ875DRAFT_382990 [Amylocarpus encephaloides]|uniref:Uncharacterized protein n=1 Tax=Amylocarpus encephaloides TaxID=45428 RepID=A0A9P8C2H5_9HELO|nr:hypothetical protein BJ875DRAFT_382990 [Amylocarpus encephaloides]
MSVGLGEAAFLKIPRTASLTSITSSLSSSPTSSPTSLLPSSTITLPVTSIPPPAITPPPSIVLDANGEIESADFKAKWHLTTYYTCLPRGTTSRCGWHEPVLPGGTEIAWAEGRGVDLGVVLGVALGVGVVVM